MIGYKAMNKDMTCRGFQYKVGNTYEIEGELEICKNGFHFCKNIIDTAGYYNFYEDMAIICEIEALGEIIQEGTKFCTNKIKIIREVSRDEIYNILSEDHNSGICNSGIYNSGNFNPGNYNSGNHNSGNRNSGNRNSGNCNSGSFNSGSYNSGICNSGDYNLGGFNSGSYNSGIGNSGGYNSGDHNSGFFNSNTPTIRLFNKDSGMTYSELFKLMIDWADLKNSKDIIENLPNYDAQIFYECTGIDWRQE